MNDEYAHAKEQMQGHGFTDWQAMLGSTLYTKKHWKASVCHGLVDIEPVDFNLGNENGMGEIYEAQDIVERDIEKQVIDDLRESFMELLF